MVDCAGRGISCIGGRPGVELDIHQSTDDWPTGGDLVVCWAVFGFIRPFYLSFLRHEDVFALARYRLNQTAVLVAAGDVVGDMGGRAAQFELAASIWRA